MPIMPTMSRVEADAAQQAGEPADRRARGNRREGDRRSSQPGRRGPDFRAGKAARRLDVAGLAVCALGVLVALWASTHAPVASTPSPQCGDGLGGQVVRHRQLSLLWVPGMVAMIIGTALPSARRRPVGVLVLVGLFLGLAVAAVLRIDSWVEGFCLT